MQKNSLMTFLTTYLIILLAVYLLQRHMIYFPERHVPEQHMPLLATLNLKPWPSNEDRRAIISALPLTRTAQGTVIVFHGNAGSAIHRTYYIHALQQLGFRVIIAEYPGYGERPGKPSEQAFVHDGLNTVKRAYQQYGGPLFLCGESLGSGVVAGIIAADAVPVKGLLLITPFDSLANVAQRHYWFFLAKWLVMDKYDNIKKLKQFTGNSAVILAEKDEVIPNQSTLALYHALSGNKKLWRFEQSGHNTLPFDPGNTWWQEAMEHIDSE